MVNFVTHCTSALLFMLPMYHVDKQHCMDELSCLRGAWMQCTAPSCKCIDRNTVTKRIAYGFSLQHCIFFFKAYNKPYIWCWVGLGWVPWRDFNVLLLYELFWPLGTTYHSLHCKGHADLSTSLVEMFIGKQVDFEDPSLLGAGSPSPAFKG